MNLKRNHIEIFRDKIFVHDRMLTDIVTQIRVTLYELIFHYNMRQYTI